MAHTAAMNGSLLGIILALFCPLLCLPPAALSSETVGSAACTRCHHQQYAHWETHHRQVPCETCHGPAQTHIRTKDILDIAVPALPRRAETLCLTCHGEDAAPPLSPKQMKQFHR